MRFEKFHRLVFQNFFVHCCYGWFMFTDQYVVSSASVKMTAGTVVGGRVYNFMK